MPVQSLPRIVSFLSVRYGLTSSWILCAGLGPHFISSITKLEEVYEVTTRCVLSKRHLSYPEFHECPEFFPLQKLRRLGYFIETLRILQGFVSVDPAKFSSIYELNELRSHLFKLSKLTMNTTLRQNFFMVSLVSHRNKPPWRWSWPSSLNVSSRGMAKLGIASALLFSSHLCLSLSHYFSNLQLVFGLFCEWTNALWNRRRCWP